MITYFKTANQTWCFCIAIFCLSNQTIAQVQSNVVKDKNGNSYNIKIMPDTKTWLTTNLYVTIPESYCYENSEKNCKQYGRLYTWNAAVEGCKTLGADWRLPTNEEWQQMVKAYGGIFGDSNDSGKTAYKSLLSGGVSAFNAVLGGNREVDQDKYARIEAHGFYWTATEDGEGQAFYLNFGKGSRKLFKQDGGEKRGAFSVRCIKDAGRPKE